MKCANVETLPEAFIHCKIPWGHVLVKGRAWGWSTGKLEQPGKVGKLPALSL